MDNSTWAVDVGGDGAFLVEDSYLTFHNTTKGGHVRTLQKGFSLPLVITATLDKSGPCSDHYVKVSTKAVDNDKPWKNVPGVVTFAWNCNERVIYGSLAGLFNLTACASHPTQYDVEIVVAEDRVSWRDLNGACDPLVLAEPFGDYRCP